MYGNYESNLRKYPVTRTIKTTTAKQQKMQLPKDAKSLQKDIQQTIKSNVSLKKSPRRRQVAIDKDIVTLMGQQQAIDDIAEVDNASLESVATRRTFVMDRQQPNVMYTECLANEMVDEKNKKQKSSNDNDKEMDAKDLIQMILGKTTATSTANAHTPEYNIKR